jgi:hypothetical protein
LYRRAFRSNDLDAADALQQEFAAIKRADDRTERLYHYFSQQWDGAASRHSEFPSSSSSSASRDTVIPLETPRTASFLLTEAERAKDVETYKQMIAIYTDECGVADDYSMLPHFKLMANALNANLIPDGSERREKWMNSFRHALRTHLCLEQ